MNILLLVHPDFAIENWGSNPNKLKSYYDDVVNYVNNFDGISIIHLMKPRTPDLWPESIKLYDAFVREIKSIGDVVKFDNNDLGCTFGNEFDEILLKHQPQKIFIGGGYYGDCLRQTWNKLYKQYGTYIKELGTKIYKIPSLIYVPGATPHRLSDSELNKYQKEWLDQQSGRSSWMSWENMPNGESFEVTEDVEIVLDGKKFLLESGDTIVLETVSTGGVSVQSSIDVSGGKDSGIPERYKNMGFTKVGVKKKSNRPGKKWMVLAKKGDKYKVVHGGDSKMKDYTQHGSEERRKKFWDRMGGKNSAKAQDPFSPLYWHKKFGTW